MRKILIRLSAVILTLLIFISVPGNLLCAKAATATSAAGIVNTGYTSLNVRSSPSLSASILTGLSNGSYVTLISKSGDWWKIEYSAGAYGYVYASNISQVSGESTASVRIASAYLNVRSGPGSSYSVKSKLYNGNIVIVLSASGGWSKILYRGTQVGYVSSQYLGSLMAWPAPASSKVSQGFISGTHLGIDIPSLSGMAGANIIAAFGGKVVYSGWLGDYGYVVYINSYFNGQYIQTRYAHLESMPNVSVGNVVGIGQNIGKMGSTGKSSGAHLHFEVRIRHSSDTCIANSQSTPANPLNYVSY